MECYYGSEVEDVVPEDYEQSDMISSLESWTQLGLTSFWGSSFLKKKSTHMTREELTFNGGENFYTSIDMVDSSNERSKSNSSSMSQELYNNGGSFLWNDQADFQQFTDEEARIDRMDDIFFSSLLEEDPTENSNNPPGNNVNVFEGEMVNSQNAGDQRQIGQNSIEESVLKDLKMVTAQFTDKTRICFRDAFYRLAESSRQPVNSCEEGEPMMTSSDDTLRAGAEVSESDTNVMDRALASLMFAKFDFEDNEDEQQVVSCCQDRSDLHADAVVPIGGMQPAAY